MKKKITAVALVVAILALALIGGTLAYFTDTKDVTNTFTVGNVAITLTEHVVTKGQDNKWTASTETTEQGNTYENVYPGAVLPKDPTVTNTGANPAYVRVKVTVTDAADFKAACAAHQITDLTTIFGGFVKENWKLEGQPVEDTASDTLTYTYRYNTILAPGASTGALFTSVTIPSVFTSAEMEKLTAVPAEGTAATADDQGFTITVVAEAIQADSFADADAAWTAFNAQK